MSTDSFAQLGTIKITDTKLTKNNYRRRANVDVSGIGGSIFIQGWQIIIENTYIWADTHGDKNGQGITIKSDELIGKGARITTEVLKNGIGNGGNIDITARKVILTDGMQIAASTRSIGNSGKITMNVEEKIEISGYFSLLSLKDSKSGLLSNTSSSGNGGPIFIKTKLLTLKDDSNISTQTMNTGNAGDVALEVDNLKLTEEAQIDLNANNKLKINNTGDGGTLTIRAKNSVLVSGKSDRPSALVSNTKTNGNGGEINISATQLSIENNGTIQAGTEGNGGYIFLNIDKLNLNQSGSITAESFG